MASWKSHKGSSPIWTVVGVLVAVCVVYITYQYLPPYLKYYQIRQAFLVISKDSGRMNADEFERQLDIRLRKIDVPFDIREIAITRVGTTVIMDVVYRVDVVHLGNKIHTLRFNPHTEVDIRKRL